MRTKGSNRGIRDRVTKERFYSSEKTCEQSACKKDIVTKEHFYGNMFF